MSDLSTRPPRRTLTVMEGREKNRPMVEGFARAAKQKGWGFYQLKSVNSDHIARFDFNGTSLDYVVYRELSRNNYHEAERLIYWLRQNHKVCININAAGGRVSTSDKHFQQGLFMLDPFIRQYALPTFEAKTKANVLAYVRSGRVRFPLILKPRRGTAGKGITLIRTVEDLAKIDSVKDLLIERYVEPECDWRVFVIGGTAVGIMRKIGDEDNPGDFRAWSAGRTKFLEDNPDTISTLSEIATRAAAVSRLEYAGVDIIREAKTGKYYILETNIAAGWSNHFIQVTHVDIPVLVLDWLENIDASRTRPPSISVRIYVEHRLQYLPLSIQDDYYKILNGTPGIPQKYQSTFAKYPQGHLYDAGYIFDILSTAYQDLVEQPETDPAKYISLVQGIEAMPLSWAGNFIGPEVGTLHDGAILSALYLFLLHKTAKM